MGGDGIAASNREWVLEIVPLALNQWHTARGKRAEALHIIQESAVLPVPGKWVSRRRRISGCSSTRVCVGREGGSSQMRMHSSSVSGRF